MPTNKKSLISGFLSSLDRFPERPALYVKSNLYTYEDLYNRAISLAATLDAYSRREEPFLSAVLATKSITAYAAILGILFRGYGYVPLSIKYPRDRIKYILNDIKCNSIIADNESADLLIEVLKKMEKKMIVIIPNRENVDNLKDILPDQIVLGEKDILHTNSYIPKIVSPDSIAYIIYTSGTTGKPKGVMVANKNVMAFIEYMVERYGVTEKDRLSQTFNLTFDPSVFDLFVTWHAGASFYSFSDNDLLNPARSIKKNQLTIWYSVPSLAIFMKKLGSLKPNSFPSLHYSLFAGEPLPMEIAASWCEAAPNSLLENLYGPTEMTVTVTYYRWDPQKSPEECYHGIVPIGYPNPGMIPIICDEKLSEVPVGEKGELLMAGPQVTLGYWGDPEKTAKAFVKLPGRKGIFYRTGDLVRKTSENGPIQYIGRIDSQIKVLGQRVELEEIEAIIREESGVSGVVAIGWPITESGAGGIEVFIEGDNIDIMDLKSRISVKLPAYMVPRRIHLIPKLPVNTSGKYDRKALIKKLEEME